MRCLDWYGDRSLLVADIALACCALESQSAAAHYAASPSAASRASQVPTAEAPAPGMPATVEATSADRVAVVVSGTVTDAALPLVLGVLDEFPEATVISFGACASSGGPYWDSYAVTKGIGQFLDVDVFVPGCPPPPGALRQALDEVRRSAGPGAQPGAVGGGAPAIEAPEVVA